ncbi:MAG: signal peptidase I [Lachnospiraceae bacterium]|nr:signal peptidase I [Lachnospiraceae bacterium]
MKKIFQIYQICLHFVTAAFLFLALINLMPRFFGIRPFVVLSGSMEPEISTGAVVFVDTRAAPEQMHVGDVITYQLNGTNITHRIVAETVSAVTTKGDANEQADFSPVPRASILGLVLFAIPFLGFIYSIISQPVFIAVLSSLLAVNLIIEAICSLKTHTRKEKEKST